MSESSLFSVLNGWVCVFAVLSLYCCAAGQAKLSTKHTGLMSFPLFNP